MAIQTESNEIRQLRQDAYLAMDEGRLSDASAMFATLIEGDESDATFHYMLGLAQKYRRNWQASLAANRRAIACTEGNNDGAIWNAGIAATALNDWATARAMWTQYGIQLPEGEGPIEGRFGICSVRLNPWGDGETLYARRIDPARAVLLNVPLPQSGYRWGDVVLNDGASTGQRAYGDGVVPVLNALQLLQRSEHDTFAVFVDAATSEDLQALLNSNAPGLGEIEDWTDSIRHLCLRCSFGAAHQNHNNHASQTTANDCTLEWNSERNLGVAAQSRRTVEQVLKRWSHGSKTRWVEGIEHRPHALSEPQEGQVWWRAPKDSDGDSE